MTEPEAGTTATSETTNTAEGGSSVGIQAESVHNSNVYFMSSDATPSEKFEVGKRYLDNGVPGKARELIEDAIARNLDNAEVRFHWMLSMLSKRSYRDLSTREREQLRRLPEWLRNYADDPWRTALTAVWEVLDKLDSDGGRSGAAERLESLPATQRGMIVRHLDLVLTGGLKDHLWATTCKNAETAKLEADRLNRAWAYFQSDPASPKVRMVRTSAASRSEWFWTIVGSVVFLAAFGQLIRMALSNGQLLSISALALAAGAGYVCARAGVDWHYRTARLAANERAHSNDHIIDHDLEAGFPKRVDNSFEYYAYKYAPEGVRDRFLRETIGIRLSRRNEVIELYSNTGTRIEAVQWLIRCHIKIIRSRWHTGTLHEYRRTYRTPLRTRAQCAASFIVLLLAVATIAISAIHVRPFPAAVSVVIALASGGFAAIGWLRILSNRRQLTDERYDHDELSALIDKDYKRWKSKLAEARPDESQMERWLDADKVVFIDEALRIYQLAWRDVIAHAILQAPARSYTRARVNDGPWRYSKYELRVFLITHKGVREVGTELDFKLSTRKRQERSTFRFDAVSSVQVRVAEGASYTLGLTLTNGPTRNIRIVDAEPPTTDNPTDLSELSLDAAGFVHTLHILEGIAAEGKGWIGRENVKVI